MDETLMLLCFYIGFIITIIIVGFFISYGVLYSNMRDGKLLLKNLDKITVNMNDNLYFSGHIFYYRYLGEKGLYVFKNGSVKLPFSEESYLHNFCSHPLSWNFIHNRVRLKVLKALEKIKDNALVNKN